jgi:hypothetical protein
MFIKSDAGRSISKRSKQRNDCVVRAIAVCRDMAYDEAYDLVAGLGRKSGRSTPKKIWQKYCNDHAEKHSFPAVAGESRMNLENFAKSHRKGKWLVQMAGHVVAVIDGNVYDDSRPNYNMCVYAAWEF